MESGLFHSHGIVVFITMSKGFYAGHQFVLPLLYL